MSGTTPPEAATAQAQSPLSAEAAWCGHLADQLLTLLTPHPGEEEHTPPTKAEVDEHLDAISASIRAVAAAWKAVR